MASQDYPPHPRFPSLLGMRYKRRSRKPVEIQSWSYWHSPPVYHDCPCKDHPRYQLEKPKWHYEGTAGVYVYVNGTWTRQNQDGERYLNGGAPWRVRLI